MNNSIAVKVSEGSLETPQEGLQISSDKGDMGASLGSSRANPRLCEQRFSTAEIWNSKISMGKCSSY
jgi:hypothetical protein